MFAEGIIKVLSGSVMLAYIGPDGALMTQVINGLQKFDARTGTLSRCRIRQDGHARTVTQLQAGLTPIPRCGFGQLPLGVHLTALTLYRAG